MIQELLVALRDAREKVRATHFHLQSMTEDGVVITEKESKEVRNILDDIDKHSEKAWHLAIHLDEPREEEEGDRGEEDNEASKGGDLAVDEKHDGR